VLEKMSELAAILARRRQVNVAKGEVSWSGEGSGPIDSKGVRLVGLCSLGLGLILLNIITFD